MEILIVIALMALLIGVVVQNIGGSLTKGQVQTAQIFVRSSLETPLLTYRMSVGRYPSTEEGLMALIKAPDSAGSRWSGPYLKFREMPVDPWGNPYQYMCPGRHNPDGYDIWSWGPDGKESDDDIGNWARDEKLQ